MPCGQKKKKKKGGGRGHENWWDSSVPFPASGSAFSGPLGAWLLIRLFSINTSGSCLGSLNRGKVQVILRVRAHIRAQSFQLHPTLCDPMDCSPPGFSVHGIV